MYLENQYFSSSVLGAALDVRLREANAPEVVVVSRLTEEGWLEERTMGVLRARLHDRLQGSDVHDRYRLFYPYIPDLERPNLLNVHSKVLIADDELCSVGSANFNNRSMGFDTECNIAIEACGRERIRAAIAGLRHRLMAEHLATDPDVVASAMARHGGSVIRAIDALQRPGRTLAPIDPVVPADIDALVPATVFIDPERPIDPEALVYDFVPPEARKPMAGRVARFAAGLLLLAAAGAVWRWTPMRDWIALGSLVSVTTGMADSSLAAFAVFAVYIVAGLLVTPITVLIVATSVVFGPIPGGVYALSGALLNAAVTYWVGQHLGRDLVRRFAGSQLNLITFRLARKGVLAVVIIRLLPIAPFSIVNAVAGASHFGLRDFLLGTAIGMAPGIALTVTFVDRVKAALSHPGPVTYALLAAVSAMVAALALFVWRRIRPRRRRSGRCAGVVTPMRDGMNLVAKEYVAALASGFSVE